MAKPAISTNIVLDVSGLKKLPDEIKVRGKGIVRAAAEEVRSRAWHKAPVATGRLRDSLKVEEEPKSGGLGYIVSSDCPYSLYQELGFHHWLSGAWIQNPFLIPALEEVRPLYTEWLKELIARAAASAATRKRHERFR